MQMHLFNSSVDLSSNKLSGTLVDTYQPPNASLTLTVNRLSGKVPSSLRATNLTVNIVEGNLFGCPQLSNDVNSNKTACGSINLLYPVIAWFVLSVVVLLFGVCVLYCKITITIQVLKLVSDWWRASYRCLSSIQYKELYHTQGVIQYLERACTMALILVALYMFIAMMSFIAIKLHGTDHINSLYQVQYLYTTTAAYLVGMTPMLLIWLYITLSGLVVLLLSMTFGMDRYTSSQGSDQQRLRRIDTNDTSVEIYYIDSIKSVAVRLVVSLAVSALAIATNYGFVQIVYVYKPPNLTAVNLAFAIIKTVVNATVVPYSTKLVPQASRQSHTVLMMIMVNVVSPGLAVLLTSPLCLFNYIYKKSISASYQYPAFDCGTNSCEIYSVPGESTIAPQWFYSYQCSSSYLNIYLPNFIYLYIISGIVTPFVNLVAMVLSSSSTRARTIQLNHRQEQSMISATNFLLQLIGDKLRVGRVFYIRDGSKDTLETSAMSTSVNPIASSSVEMSVVDKDNSNQYGNSSTPCDIITSRITTVSVDVSSSEDYDIEIVELMPSL